MKLGLKNIEFSIEKISKELGFQLDLFIYLFILLGKATDARLAWQKLT